MHPISFVLCIGLLGISYQPQKLHLDTWKVERILSLFGEIIATMSYKSSVMRIREAGNHVANQ